MISHIDPVALAIKIPDKATTAIGLRARAGAAPIPNTESKASESAWSAGAYGPLRVEHHSAARRQGARLDPGFVSVSAHPRRFRGALLLSGARPAGDRCGRPGAARRDRSPGGAFPAVFGRAGGIPGRALRQERNREHRRGRPGGSAGGVEIACRDHRCGRVRRSRPQVPDLGAAAFPRASREGHRGGAHADATSGLRASGRGRGGTGMMTGRDSGPPDVAGGLARHIPVLVRPVVEHLSIRAGGVYVDGTFGAGGYARAVLAAADCRVLAVDRDQSAVARAADLVDQFGGRLTVAEGRFSALDEIAASFGIEAVDGVALDLGVSSMQLDTAERGFSFRLDGPLDMRMEARGPTAADVIAAASERTLADIIFMLGEERHARAVARAIVRARDEGPIRTTAALADIVARVVRARPGDIHPATRTFQALRLFVNDELGELARGLLAAERILRPGGRLVVVSFHSLEDRMVKTFLVARAGSRAGSRHLPQAAPRPASFAILTKRPVGPDEAEIAANPRARSAKLRAAERTAAPPDSVDRPALPRLPSLA